MSEQKHADRCTLLCVIALVVAGAAHAASKDAASKNAATKYAVAKSAAIKNAPAKTPAAKTPAAKTPAAKSAAARKVAAKRPAAKNPPAAKVPLTVSLPRLAGRWKGDTSGMEVQIVQGSIGWEAWLSTDGQARITQPEADPKIIKIQSRTLTCTYTVSVPAAQTMRWEITPGQPESRCLGDSFTKLGVAPQRGRPAAPAKPAPQSTPPVTSGKQP